MIARRTPPWLLISLALPLVAVVIAAVLVLRAEREAVLRDTRSLAQRLCDEGADGFIRQIAGLDSRPLPEADASGRLKEDGFLYPPAPMPQPECEAQEWFAHGEYERVLKEAPDAMSRAGLPLAPMCAWRLLQDAKERLALVVAWDRLKTEAVERHPSAVSRALLEAGEKFLRQEKSWPDSAIRGDGGVGRWLVDEHLREIIRKHELDLLRPTSGWVGASADGAISSAMALVFHVNDLGASRQPGQSGWRIIPALSADIQNRFLALAVSRSLPSFAKLLVAHPPLTSAGPLSNEQEVLAAADRPIVRAFVVLSRNQDFHLAVLRHMRWTGGALAVAFLACAFGAWQTLRAYRRQEQLAEQKSNFISSVSHELRAPLSSVRLMAESLCDGTVREPGRVAEYHRVMHEESTRLCSLVENVLDAARIERGVKTYHFAPCDPASIIESATRILSPRAERQRVSWKIEADTFDPPPLADESALRQALVNLLDNALKHSPENATVTIKAARSDQIHWTLSVADQGPGIPVAERERVFERFYRIGSELCRETTGAGLGLALVKHVIEAHRGTVSISDAPGGGAMVICRFDEQSKSNEAVASQFAKHSDAGSQQS